ncbi:MAG TPA: methyltransferase domain-containing protein [Thermoanaerobaculia bacterium]|nr:methyltransferase domain-containing protein [Thermoanaerobaculia bacterium]
MSDERYVDGPPAGAEGWREVWRDDRRYRSGGFLGALLQKVVRRAGAADRDRQRDFNEALLDLLDDVRSLAEAVRDDLRADIAAVQRDLQNAESALAAGVRQSRELVHLAADRNDALIAALDQKIETLAVRLRDVTNPLIEAAGSRSPAATDFLYRRLEDGLRGSEAEVREAMRPYVDRARAAQPALDVGCGRGEFLALCGERGIEARGFDTNERSVADLRQRGFDVTLAGVPECFTALGEGSAGSILAAHVVEHLPVEALFALFAEAARVLRRGGLLMIETPNAESLVVSASEFWRDPTHLAPRHPAALVLLGREYGFDVEEVRAVHPLPEGTALELEPDDPPALRRVIEAINARLFGPQDLRLIFAKR